jgi:hypothetical protein
MDTEGLSVICAGLGIAEEDENGNRIGYIKGEYCLGILPFTFSTTLFLVSGKMSEFFEGKKKAVNFIICVFFFSYYFFLIC